jgi:hypothetical protein
MPSVLIIFFGMAIFCVRRDTSDFSAKALWFVFFLGAVLVGPAVYYFTVYRGYMKRKKACGVESEALNP